MLKKVELSPGIILLIVIWIACAVATAANKENYIDVAAVLTILYGIFRIQD